MAQSRDKQDKAGSKPWTKVGWEGHTLQGRRCCWCSSTAKHCMWIRIWERAGELCRLRSLAPGCLCSGSPHATGSACPCDCSSTVPHGKYALLFRLKQLLGSHRVAASRDCCPCGWSTCQAQMATDSFSTPGQGVLAELTEEPVPAMAKASSISESDQGDESAEDGARTVIVEGQHTGAPASAPQLPGQDHVC